MARGPLFKGSRDAFTVEYCAHCGGYMHIRNIITVGDKEFKVCSLACEKALKAAHEVSQDEKVNGGSNV